VGGKKNKQKKQKDDEHGPRAFGDQPRLPGRSNTLLGAPPGATWEIPPPLFLVDRKYPRKPFPFHSPPPFPAIQRQRTYEQA